MSLTVPPPEKTNFDKKRASLAVASHPERLASIVKIDVPRMGPQPFNLWPKQRRLLRLALRAPFHNPKYDLLCLKARQLGATWTLGSLLGLWECIAYPTGGTLAVSINEDDAKEIVARAKFMYLSAPEWFHEAFPCSTDASAKFGIAHREGESYLLSLSSSGNAGRSRTFRRVLADERARWGPGADERMASIRPTIADFGVLNEVSTAQGYNSFHQNWEGAVDEGVPIEEGNGYLRIFAGALDHPGRTREWVMRERSRYVPPELGMQEYPLTPEEAFLASGRCVFDVDALKDLIAHSALPALSFRLRVVRSTLAVADPDSTGSWQVWRMPERGHSYLVAADVCGGSASGDYSAACVYDLKSWDQVAAYHGRPHPSAFADELRKAGWLYSSPDSRRPALLVPEANNHGQAVVALLREWAYPNIYAVESFDHRSQEERMTLGWVTDAKSRPLALSSLKDAISRGLLGIRDKAALTECLSFVVRTLPSGTEREEADESCHDDRVMAHAIAAAVLAHTRVGRPARTHAPRGPYRYRVSERTGY